MTLGSRGSGFEFVGSASLILLLIAASFLAYVCAWPSVGLADGDEGSPTGPIDLPLPEQASDADVRLDPLAPGNEEPVPDVEPPRRVLLPNGAVDYQYPVFNSYFDPDSSGFITPSSNPKLAFVAVGTGSNGGGRVYVGSDQRSRVFIFDAHSLAPLGSFNGADITDGEGRLGGVHGIAFYRGEVYVRDAYRVVVFDANGNYERSFRTVAQVSGPYRGLDVAWGEVWLTSSPNTYSGGLVEVYDAKSGGLKGVLQQPFRVHCSVDAPVLESGGGDGQCGLPGPRIEHWQDVAIAPEIDGVFTGMRGITRTGLPLASGLPDYMLGNESIVESTDPFQLRDPCIGCPSDYADEDPFYTRGTDAVWGMKWLLAVTPGSACTSCAPAGGEAIREYPLEGYGAWARKWLPMQSATGQIQDVAYNSREVRIDWSGDLTDSEWQRGERCLDYVVSEADIFVIGPRGERWYELARNFESIMLSIDGTVRETRTGTQHVQGRFCVPLDSYPSGTHEIKLTAIVAGNPVRIANTNLRIDHDSPAVGTLTQPGAYARGSATVAGTVSDAHSGPARWEVQASPEGQSSWQQVCRMDDPVADIVASCEWDTTETLDGQYRVRAVTYDNVSASRGGPNAGYSPEASVIVDNTPPSLSDPAPAVASDFASESFEEPAESVFLTQSDSGSGVESTQLEFNTATDGSSSGQWVPAQAPSMTGDGEVSSVWDTSGVEDGLHRVRAVSHDRAGNTAQIEWQAVFSQRRRCPSVEDVQGIHRCYAGVVTTSTFQNRPDADGVRGDIRLPGYVPKGSGFSVNAFGLYGTRFKSIEAGTNNHGCARPADNKADAWFSYAQFQSPRGFVVASPCYSRLNDSDRKGITTMTNDRGIAHVEISGQVKAIVKRKKRYRNFGQGFNASAYGETGTYRRDIGGEFTEIDFLFNDAGGWQWRPDRVVRYERGAGYAANFRGGGTNRFFCVHGPKRGCPAP